MFEENGRSKQSRINAQPDGVSATDHDADLPNMEVGDLIV